MRGQPGFDNAEIASLTLFEILRHRWRFRFRGSRNPLDKVRCRRLDGQLFNRWHSQSFGGGASGQRWLVRSTTSWICVARSGHLFGLKVGGTMNAAFHGERRSRW